ncbi:hypothetical protein DN069_32270 [Streptacidiphilus pinicola]|uniref:TfuA-like core domain-containing protein n=1 Tax=Streptacidiphilus pinicola TaxID=2219663 RepID=A0A2X0I9B6_9ACTN|nr:TfuA-like protein [Streptacidiphilus pinicola]RAG81532.1 hypothetical protein DN069_32270 [Streptacidiphilus pinicola]
MARPDRRLTALLGGLQPAVEARPVVYGAPSLQPLDPQLLAQVELRPPVRRGDLARLHERRPGTVVLVDGLFGGSLTVTPAECRELLDAGWTVVGASSMGALRAADLWPLGMIGVGDVYALYRLGTLTSDADVAVALDTDRGHRELTVSTVQLRAVLAAASGEGIIGAAQRTRMARLAERLHWSERSWGACRELWQSAGVPRGVIAHVERLGSDPRTDPKVRDAETALRAVLAHGYIESAAPPQRCCPVCTTPLPGTALFCSGCVSDAHETCL